MLDRFWERLGIGAAITTVAGGGRVAAAAVDRMIFALGRDPLDLVGGMR